MAIFWRSREVEERSFAVARPLFRQYLRRFLPAVIAGALLAITAVLLTGYWLQQRSNRQQQLHLVAVYAKSLAKPLWDCDSAVAVAIARTLHQLPEIAGMQLTAPCDNIRIKLGIGINSNEQNILRRTVYYRDPALNRYRVGELQVQFYRDSALDRLLANLWAVLAILLLLSALLAGLSVRLHRRLVSAPLQSFRADIERQLEHRFTGDPQPVVSGSSRPDEIGAVAQSFAGLMKELNRRLLRQRALTSCSRLLLQRGGHGDNPFNDVLQQLLKGSGADRIHLCLNESGPAGELCFSLRYEAVQPGVPSELGQTVLQSYPYSNGLQRWRELLERHVPVRGRVAEMEGRERYIAGIGGALNVLYVPVVTAEHWYGFIGAAGLYREREWSASELLFLQSAADLTGAYLQREEAARQMGERIRFEKSLARYARLLLEQRSDMLTAALQELLEGVDLGALLFCRLRSEEQQRVVPVDAVYSNELPAKRCQPPQGLADPDGTGWGAALRRLHSGVPLLLSGDQLEERLPAVAAVLLLPVQIDGRLYGFLLCIDYSGTRFQHPRELRLLQTAADILSTYWANRIYQQLKEDVDRIVRHDLKGPLNAILSVPQLLADDTNLTGEQQELLQLIDERGRKMLRYINFTLNLHKLEAGEYSYRPEPVDLGEVLRDITGQLQSQCSVRKCGIRCFYQGEALSEHRLILPAEEFLLHSVLNNLISNAVQAAQPGETVRVSVSREDQWRITVSNRSVVPEAVRERFFDKYVTAGKPGGTGLGTYSAKLMVELMGGSISMTTGEQQGTVVTVCLPDTGG